VQTNIGGAANLVRAIRENDLNVEKVIGISTGQACKPINVMGMTKALQERVLIEGRIEILLARVLCAFDTETSSRRADRSYRLFVEQVQKGETMTVTLPEMTRFLLSLDSAVDTVFEAVTKGKRGQTFVPKVPAANIVDLAKAIMGDKEMPITYTGIRPGEKVHEIMVSEEECYRTIEQGRLLRHPALFFPSSAIPMISSRLSRPEYSSRDNNIS
jgi:UDP-glucose 4-epimerase